MDEAQDEFQHLLQHGDGHRLDFDPLSEFVDNDEEVGLAGWLPLEGTNHIQLPDHGWLGERDGLKFLSNMCIYRA